MPEIKSIILASSNQGKAREFAATLKNIEIKTIEHPDFDPEETADTFLGNAAIKAIAAAELTREYCLADDSGLVIDALDGRPGIYSARYLKEEYTKHQAKNGEEEYKKVIKQNQTDSKWDFCKPGLEKLIQEVQAQPNKKARFTCALALATPEGEIIWQDEAYWQVHIGTEIRGSNGFGYDPIAVPYSLDPIHNGSTPEELEQLTELNTKTAAELEAELKNQLSHRAQAIAKLEAWLKQ